MSFKKSILVFVDWYEPGYKAGGPIRSIAGFVNNMKPHFKIFVITRDRDLNQAVPYEKIQINEWMKLEENLKILYLSPNGSVKNIIDKTRNKYFDWIYTNSLFSIQYSILPLLLFHLKILKSKNFLIAPRGEFKPSALAIKPRKKKKYLFISKLFKFYKKNYWHATSDEEMEYILAHNPGASVFLSPNLSKTKKNNSNRLEKKPKQLRIIFLSRIISYKNLDYAIKILKDLPNSENIIFDVYGPIEDQKYFAYCFELAKETGVTVSYKGELEHYQVSSTFSQYHLFLFPTKGENFGHVIAESLLAGCPVLTSDKTPWDDMNRAGAGWTFSINNNEKFIATLHNIYLMDNFEFEKIQQDTMKYASAKINSKTTVDQYYELFQNNSLR